MTHTPGRIPHANRISANYSAFEIEDEVLGNLREYSMANSLYWVSAGHCERDMDGHVYADKYTGAS